MNEISLILIVLLLALQAIIYVQANHRYNYVIKLFAESLERKLPPSVVDAVTEKATQRAIEKAASTACEAVHKAAEVAAEKVLAMAKSVEAERLRQSDKAR